MGMDSNQIGTILLGTGVLFIALLLQQEYSSTQEAFQNAAPAPMPMPPAAPMPMAPAAPMPMPPAAPAPMPPAAPMPVARPTPTITNVTSVPAPSPAAMAAAPDINPNMIAMFQSAKKAGSPSPGSEAPPNSTAAAIDSITPKQRFALKNAEIQDMFGVIKANKPAKDKTLSLILDNEIFNKLNTIYMEVSSYLDMMSVVYSNVDVKPNEINQIQMTIYQQTQLLYNVYVTMPSMVVATNLVVDSSSATLDTLNNSSVITETKNAVEALLAPMPTASQKIASYEEILMTNFTAIIQNPANLEQITQFTIAFKKYTNLVDLQLKTYSGVLTSSGTATNTDINVVNTMNKGVALVTAVNKFLSGMTKQLKALPPSSINPSIATLIQSIETAMQGYESKKSFVLNTMEGNNIPIKESFQSYQNSYNAPSLSQAQEFRPGKKGLVNEVFAFMK